MNYREPGEFGDGATMLPVKKLPPYIVRMSQRTKTWYAMKRTNGRKGILVASGFHTLAGVVRFLNG